MEIVSDMIMQLLKSRVLSSIPVILRPCAFVVGKCVSNKSSIDCSKTDRFILLCRKRNNSETSNLIIKLMKVLLYRKIHVKTIAGTIWNNQ